MAAIQDLVLTFRLKMRLEPERKLMSVYQEIAVLAFCFGCRVDQPALVTENESS